MYRFKVTWQDVGMGILAISMGSAIIYTGDVLLGVNLEMFYGVATFHPLWIVDLFFVPFLAGIVVSLIFGLGGKILAHLAPLPVRILSYYQISSAPVEPEFGVLLPLGYWFLVLILAMEFAAIGGVVGEILVKKTYGRTDKRLLHKRYQKTTQVSARATGKEE